MRLHRAQGLATTLFLSALTLPVLAAPAVAQVDQGVFDNHKAYWHNYNVDPLQGLVWSEDSSTLYLLNQSGARLVSYDVGRSATVWEMPIGPGASNLVRRPGTQELWIPDRVTSVITVVDLDLRTVVASIPVGKEPHGLDFTPDGQRAYVSCSADDQVDVIDTATRQVVHSIDIPAREPRGLLYLDGSIYVASHLSGNASAPISAPGSKGEGAAIDIVDTNNTPGLTPLPDRDLFRIAITASPTTDHLDPSWTRSGVGTILFNLNRAHGDDLMWVANLDSLNAQFKGEAAFIEGQVVRNRLALVSTDGATAHTQIDLDALIPDANARCAPPTGVAINATGTRAYVCGYGSSNVTVLGIDGATTTWIGEIQIVQNRSNPSVSLTDGQNGAGPRTCVVSPNGAHLAVLNSGESSFSLIPLRNLPPATGWTWDAPPAKATGWDPLPKEIVQGRLDFSRTRNSKSGTSSCASCHIGGHTDMLAWDLGTFLDHEGTPRASVGHALDNKGPLMTQTARSLREVGPWHWRGEKRSLFEFDNTFIGLLEREVDGKPEALGIQFNYTARYLDSLAWPANPHQNADRSLSPNQVEGRDLFHNLPVLGAMACVDCHALPLGTSGEVVSHGLGGQAPTTVVPPLRGVSEKALSPEFVVGGDVGTRNELGYGLGHTGSFTSIEDHILQLLPDGTQRLTITPAQASKIADFLGVLDTGIAPAAATQLTLDASNNTGRARDDFAYVIAQADAGHCDVILNYGPIRFAGRDVWPGGAYDPVTATFRMSSSAMPNMTIADVVALAVSGTPITIQGTPLWKGNPRGIDRDNDEVLDLDELILGTDPEAADSDRDGQPDGYEIQGGSDPLVRRIKIRDRVAPQLVGNIQVMYVTQTAVKLEFYTDEPTLIGAGFDGNTPQLRAPIWPVYGQKFSIIVNQLTPGTTHTINLILRDPSGNVQFIDKLVTTPDRVLPAPVHVESGAITVSGPTRNRIASIEVKLMDSDGSPAPQGYSVRGRLYHVGPGGIQTISETLQTWLVQTTGQAYFTAFLPPTIGPGDGAFVFVVDHIDELPGQPVYVIAENQQGPIWQPF